MSLLRFFKPKHGLHDPKGALSDQIKYMDTIIVCIGGVANTGALKSS